LILNFKKLGKEDKILYHGIMSFKSIIIQSFLVVLIILSSGICLAEDINVPLEINPMTATNPNDQATTAAPQASGGSANFDTSLRCGDASSPDQSSRSCCTGGETDLNAFQKLIGAEKWGCILPSFLGGWCVSEALTKVGAYIKDGGIAKTIGIDDLRSFLAQSPCVNGIPQGSGQSCVCIAKDTTLGQMCDMYLINDSEFSACQQCMSSSTRGGLYSALGCIHFDNFSGFISNSVLLPLLSLGGIVTLICIIYAAFILMTSSGDPEKIKKAKELLTSCLIGLIFVILSIFILKFITGDLLGIKMS
jgi:hypothetical protein